MAGFFTPIEPIAPMSFDKAAPVSTIKSSDSSAIPFADVLKEAVGNYISVQETVTQEGQALSLGDVDNLAQIQIDSMKASAALSTTVQLTLRVVNAYKEIMQMQV